MRERVGQRLAELNAEYAAGQKLLADLQSRQTTLEQTLLRISGAIDVLEELLEVVPLEEGPDLGVGVDVEGGGADDVGDRPAELARRP